MYLRVCWGSIQKWRLADAIFVFSLSLAPGKELIPSSGAQTFVPATQGTPLDYLALMGSGAYD